MTLNILVQEEEQMYRVLVYRRGIEINHYTAPNHQQDLDAIFSDIKNSYSEKMTVKYKKKGE